MNQVGTANTVFGLDLHGLRPARTVYWNLSSGPLVEEAVRRNEGKLAATGPLVVSTGRHTGRSPQDKAFVREPSSEQHIDWGPTNLAVDGARFDALYARVIEWMNQRDLFVQELRVGADPQYQLPVRVITQYAWHSLFARNLLIVPPADAPAVRPQFTVIDAATFQADPARDGTRSSTFIWIDFGKRVVLIGGTEYAGEIKKSVFTLMNYLLPLQGVMSMHCSANVGRGGDTAVFFGLSGTGKTTLSADPNRVLIGDDEHGWSNNGIFNFEGGCYAKMIRLSPEAEPEIYATTRMFGTVLENVVMDEVTRELDLDSEQLTENTRGAYPLSAIPNASPTGLADHPRNVIFLTADAFGVLPPVARLTPDQAMHHFLLGYTAKVAGTEIGVTEPEATFSTCFGAPFMVHEPGVYARLLGQRIDRHRADVWLVNTGWSGGPYGVGKRMKIAHTRAMITAILDGSLRDVPTEPDPIFQVAVPLRCPNVPPEVLKPRNTWPDPRAYEETAARVARRFQEAFKKFVGQVSPAVAAAGPRVPVAV